MTGRHVTGRAMEALAVEGLSAGYGSTIVLDGASFSLAPGGTIAVLGRNGVGKTTLLETLMGLTTLRAGTITLNGERIEQMPTHRRNEMGLGYVPQQREIFPSLTVEENLAVAARAGGWSIDSVFDLFPSLKERRGNSGNKLSGGEQQMLAIGRALAGRPKVLLLDEPLEGLAPIVVESLFEALAKIRDEGQLSMVLVEQKVDLALAFAHEVAILDRGRIVYRDTSAALRADEHAQGRYLGVSL
jgi:branched-chain amino acid transport system ATP-binding protein